MSNIFDSMQDGLFDLTTAVFGYDASWTPIAGGPTQTGRVNYRSPNDKDVLKNGIEYMPYTFFMEFKEGIFNGLQESVRHGIAEQVVVNGISHYVRSVNRVHDGKTIQAHLDRI